MRNHSTSLLMARVTSVATGDPSGGALLAPRISTCAHARGRVPAAGPASFIVADSKRGIRREMQDLRRRGDAHYAAPARQLPAG